jgi:arabinogalactan endo-1,4-beta-galactosidase
MIFIIWIAFTIGFVAGATWAGIYARKYLKDEYYDRLAKDAQELEDVENGIL